MNNTDMPTQKTEIDVVKITRSKRIFGWASLVFGLCFLALPLIGLAGTIKGMIGAFTELSNTGTADPEALAGDISMGLLTTFWSIIFSIPLLIAFIISLIFFLKRRKLLRSLIQK
jgi:hypothetical protein